MIAIEQLVKDTNDMIADGMPPSNVLAEIDQAMNEAIGDMEDLTLEEKLWLDDLLDNRKELEQIINSDEYKATFGDVLEQDEERDVLEGDDDE